METYFAHPRAYVEPGSTIGSGTKIWVNAQIRSGAVIGRDCVISKDTFIDSDVVLGDRCKVQNGVSLYKGLIVGDEVFLGPNSVFTNDYLPRAVNPSWQVMTTTIETGASVGANATIICGVTIRKYAMVGAGSVVTKSVPSYGLVVGNPARLIGYVCRCGRRLNSSHFCEHCEISINIEEGDND